MKTIDKLKSILEESDDPIRDKIKELITEMEEPKLLDEGWYHTAVGTVHQYSGVAPKHMAKRGAVRPTPDEAKYASLVNELWNKRKRAQDILCPGYRFVVDEDNWFVGFDHSRGTYEARLRSQHEDPLAVYFDTHERALQAEEMFDIKDLRERVRTFWG